MADENNPNEVGANIPGTLMKLLVKAGDEVKENEPIAVLEAMKMETNVLATATGKIGKINVTEGQQVVAGRIDCNNWIVNMVAAILYKRWI